jgi:hypothetical protein
MQSILRKLLPGERGCISAPSREHDPTHRAITRLKPQNLHFFPRTRHRRPFLDLAPCGLEWQKTLDSRAFCHCGPLRDMARCGYFPAIISEEVTIDMSRRQRRRKSTDNEAQSK